MFKAKVIRPNLSANGVSVLNAIRGALDEVAEDAKKDFEATVETWERQPEFEITGESIISREVFTQDKIYFFINNGTSVRYATMTPDFQAKTTPRVIGSNRGSGGVHFINRNRPRPGIEARKFDEVIAKKWEKQFPLILQKAVTEATRLSR